MTTLTTFSQPADKGQVFVYFGWRFDIDAAERLLNATPRTGHRIEVASTARVTGIDASGFPDGAVPLTRPRIDTDHAMRTDLCEPLMVATLTDPEMHLLIDGYHRLYRAWHEKVTDLPALVLTAEETRVIRLT
ncbi:hypothetical protein ABZW18_32705 [Streptomyces sp. NPDC004647]|uniref:hypothetical protein n=1 Tax=Streptomyces sp. NPDC004647 TaxID=3154671 RepID=UPI0033BBA62A